MLVRLYFEGVLAWDSHTPHIPPPPAILEGHSCWELRKLELAEPEPGLDLDRSGSVLPEFGRPCALAEQME